jgi:hypothetical protein
MSVKINPTCYHIILVCMYGVGEWNEAYEAKKRLSFDQLKCELANKRSQKSSRYCFLSGILELWMERRSFVDFQIAGVQNVDIAT